MIARSAVDRKIAEIILPLVSGMGYELIRVRLLAGKTATLQIMIDLPAGGIDVNALSNMSTAISANLDVEDPILEAYNLEVSSPGIDRPLTRLKDFDVFEGYEAKIETNQLIDGQRRFRGILAGVEDDDVLVNVKEGTIGIKFEWLAEAKLILSDDLLKEILRRQKNTKILNEDKFDDIITVSFEEEV